MKTHWQKVIIKLTIWLAVEILLSLVGLDNLADYGEFALETDNVAHPHRDLPALVLEMSLKA